MTLIFIITAIIMFALAGILWSTAGTFNVIMKVALLLMAGWSFYIAILRH